MESCVEFLILDAQVDATLAQVKSKIDSKIADQKS